jgi:hypothetical protein
MHHPVVIGIDACKEFYSAFIKNIRTVVKTDYSALRTNMMCLVVNKKVNQSALRANGLFGYQGWG